MLILSRKEGESIVIAKTITIKVTKVDGGVVTLEIAGPDDLVAPCQTYYDKRLNIIRLTLRLDRNFTLGDSIHVRICGVCGNQVRLGIDAPNDVPIDRKEIYDKKGGAMKNP